MLGEQQRLSIGCLTAILCAATVLSSCGDNGTETAPTHGATGNTSQSPHPADRSEGSTTESLTVHVPLADRLEKTAHQMTAWASTVAGDRVWIIDRYGSLFHSADLGKTWELQATPIAAHPLHLQAAANGRDLLIADYSGQLHRSADSGATWKTIALPRPEELVPKWIDEDYEDIFFDATLKYGMVIVDCTIHYTDDGGNTWQKIPVSSMAIKDRWPCVIEAYMTSSGKLNLAIGSDRNTDSYPRKLGMKYSSDNGATWTDISGDWSDRYTEIEHPPELDPKYLIRSEFDYVDPDTYDAAFDAIFRERSRKVDEAFIRSFTGSVESNRYVDPPVLHREGDRLWARGFGGIAYSDNGGALWHSLIDNNDTRSVSDLQDHNQVYLIGRDDSSYELHISLLDSTQTNSTLTRVNLTRVSEPRQAENRYRFSDFIAHRPTGTLVTLDTDEGTLYSSNDVGARWTAHELSNIEYLHESPQRIWATGTVWVSEAEQVYLSWSDDPGTDWHQQVIDGTDGDPVVCTDIGCLFEDYKNSSIQIARTNDHGDLGVSNHLVPFEPTGGGDWFDYFPDESLELIWVYLDYDSVFQSTDGGRSWREYPLEQENHLADYHHEVRSSPNRGTRLMFRSTSLKDNATRDDGIPLQYLEVATLGTEHQLRFNRLPHMRSADSYEVCWLNDDSALVAVWGHQSSVTPEIFETSDGGKTWHPGSLDFMPYGLGCRQHDESVMIDNQLFSWKSTAQD